MQKTTIALLFVCILTASVSAESAVRFDFESGDLQGFKVVDGNFDVDGLIIRNPGNLQRKYSLTTQSRNDEATGVIDSPVFVLNEPDISCHVRGGAHPNTYVTICSEAGLEIKKASGMKGNGEEWILINWHLPGLVGKKVFLRIVDEKKGSWGWVAFDDFTANGTIDNQATQEHFKLVPQAYKKLRAIEEFKKRTGKINFKALRRCLKDLAQTFPSIRPKARQYLQKTSIYEKQLLDFREVTMKELNTSLITTYQDDLQQADDKLKEIERFKNEVLRSNPHLNTQSILFIARPQYRGDHHNTATMFVTGEINTGSFVGGGAMKIYNPATGETKALLESQDGIIRDPEVSYDGERIVFSMRKNIDDDYHIYEIGADGEGLKQLTFMAGVADLDPVYMPDGSIVFSSTREPKYCGCNRHIMGNLFKMDADGANIHQIAKSTLHEGHASVMSDGRILYDRWEYIDRNFGDAQGLWTVNPDGTGQAVYWGNNTASPGGVIDARQIPGSQRTVCTFTSCHDRPWGAIAIIDRRLGIDGKAGVVQTWPADAIGLVDNGGHYDTFMEVRPKYEDPYPLSDEYFLCSRMTGDGEKMGIYLIDVFGNEMLLHTEGAGCFDPMPLKAKAVPGEVANRRDYDNGNALFYVVDVYEGTHMEGVERGSVKFLRVIESPEKRFWTIPYWMGPGGQAPGMNWLNFENKRILSTVPVEEDGSAYFEVPSDTYVFFQLLDEKGMMIQSMRSGTVAQPGELTGCVGCHDNRRTAPPVKSDRLPVAFRREPSKLNGWHGEARLFSYMKEVQPVFDKHCVSCHDFGKKAGKKLLLAGDRGITFNASYVDLWMNRYIGKKAGKKLMKRYINCVGAGSHVTQQAYSWGSRNSEIVEKITAGHKGVKLSNEEFDRIVTWIDINGPYYPSYASAYPDNLAGRSPLSNAQMKELEELTAVSLMNLAQAGRQLSSQISFDRPELSPSLDAIRDDKEKYDRAVAIIQEGKKMLEDRPRTDMEGLKMCEVDQRQQEKYLFRREKEQQNRAAIREGYKVYDNNSN